MKKVFLITLTTIFSLNTTAQITIGSEEKPNKGALLDLKMNGNIGANSTKGLSLPKVALKNIRTESDLGKTLGAKTTNTLDALDHIGLLVYNTTANEESESSRFCPGIHIWDGTQWIPIIPYAEIKTTKSYVEGSYIRSYEYLDPADPTGWPTDKEAARASGQYALGRNVSQSPSPNGTDNISDKRAGESAANTYTVSRFYVGYKVISRDYEIKKSYLCDPSAAPIWDEANKVIVTETTKEFDDGIWMTQNLNTTKTNDGGNLVLQTTSNYGNTSTGQYFSPANSTTNTHYGVLYNWAAALGIGTSTGPTQLPDAIEQGGNKNEDVIIQGICPVGWYLPNDQEWTDLANGIEFKYTSGVFSDAVTGVTKVGYNDRQDNLSSTSGFGGNLGRVLKSKTQVSSLSTNGSSNTRAQSGFDAFLVGSGSEGKAYGHGQDTYFWTSSRIDLQLTTIYTHAYFRWLRYNSANYFRGFHESSQCFSVRCKKINQ